MLPLRLHFTGELGVDEGREADNDCVYPKCSNILFYAAVSNDVLVSQRLRERCQAVHRDGNGHQDAYAAERNHDAVWHDAKRGNTIFRETGELQLHPEGHKHADLPTEATQPIIEDLNEDYACVIARKLAPKADAAAQGDIKRSREQYNGTNQFYAAEKLKHQFDGDPRKQR